MALMTGVQFPAGEEIFFLFGTMSRLALQLTWLPVQCVPRVNQPGCEAEYSPPSSTEVKNMWSCTSTSPYVFIALCLMKHKDYFTFTTL